MLLANFNRKEHLRHRAVSLRQHGFLVVCNRRTAAESNRSTFNCVLKFFSVFRKYVFINPWFYTRPFHPICVHVSYLSSNSDLLLRRWCCVANIDSDVITISILDVFNIFMIAGSRGINKWLSHTEHQGVLHTCFRDDNYVSSDWSVDFCVLRVLRLQCLQQIHELTVCHWGSFSNFFYYYSRNRMQINHPSQ